MFRIAQCSLLELKTQAWKIAFFGTAVTYITCYNSWGCCGVRVGHVTRSHCTDCCKGRSEAALLLYGASTLYILYANVVVSQKLDLPSVIFVLVYFFVLVSFQFYSIGDFYKYVMMYITSHQHILLNGVLYVGTFVEWQVLLFWHFRFRFR